MNDVLKQISVNLGVTGYDDSSLLIGIADYYGVNTAISNNLMGDILDAVGGNAALSNNYIQDIVIALGGPSTSNNWIEEWETITSGPIVYFTTTWTTTAPNETITLPYDAAGTYSGTIDWGDSNIDVNSFANNTHTYAVAGTYTVQINGDCIGWNFGNYGGSTYITSVVHWGQLQFIDARYSFYLCPNLNLSSVSDVINLTGFVDLEGMFQSSGITTINNIAFWNTSSVQTMRQMFSDATAFNQALSFNTSAVIDMDSMFQNANSFNQLLLFDTSNVQYMSYMFSDATAFNQSLNFNTSNVQYMIGMFRNASSFNQSLSTFDTSAVILIDNMFKGASSFNQPLNFNTGNVQDMTSMFQSATAFNQNIGSWNVANVTVFSDFMLGKTPATFSTANLDAIYNGWSASGVQANCNISFGTAKYTVAAVAGRAILTGVNGWTITDGGL